MNPPLPERLPLPDTRILTASRERGTLVLACDGEFLLRAGVDRAADGFPLLSVVEQNADAALSAVWAACYYFFAADSECPRIHWRNTRLDHRDLVSGLLVSTSDDETRRSEREMFWQLPGPWLSATTAAGYPSTYVMTDGKRHPRRPPKPEGEVYRRFDARLGAWISLRTLDIDEDLDRFNRWQNLPRVSEFWGQADDLDTHRKYLRGLADDPHVLSLIGCFNEQPFGYFEVYWAKEDRIAPYCDAADYDRGIHMLVGEADHRGPHKVASWLPALCHYLFLDDPRTRRLVSEPRADNARMIGHMQTLGFCRRKEFDFPHKRAALMTLDHEAFFQSSLLR